VALPPEGAKMDENDLLRRVTAAKAEFCMKCSKYAGAVTAEVLREVLRWHGIATSARDVFVEQIPVEIDLVVPKLNAVPRDGMLYRAEDALAALEVKKAGAFGEATIRKTRATFELIRGRNPRIQCAYVTLTERRGYKWAVTEANLGFPVYTFFWYRGSSEKNRRYEASGDFGKLLKCLQTVIAAQS
jgi:hypothetical protein